MLNLAMRVVIVALVYGTVMMLNQGEGKPELFMRYITRWFFLVLAIAFGIKMGIYI